MRWMHMRADHTGFVAISVRSRSLCPDLVCGFFATERATGPHCKKLTRDAAQAMDLMREARRETFRAAVFLWTIPFWEARMRIGSAAERAALAAVLSPEATASSTLRTDSFMRDVRDLLISVRCTAWRAAFRADEVLAIDWELLGVDRGGGDARPRVKVVLS